MAVFTLLRPDRVGGGAWPWGRRNFRGTFPVRRSRNRNRQKLPEPVGNVGK